MKSIKNPFFTHIKIEGIGICPHCSRTISFIVYSIDEIIDSKGLYCYKCYKYFTVKLDDLKLQ